MQLHLLLERTGLKLEGSYQIVDYEYEEGWGDFRYRFKIRSPHAPGGLTTHQSPWGTWKREGGKCEFYCTRAECHADRIFADYDSKTRELSLQLIHL